MRVRCKGPTNADACESLASFCRDGGLVFRDHVVARFRYRWSAISDRRSGTCPLPALGILHLLRRYPRPWRHVRCGTGLRVQLRPDPEWATSHRRSRGIAGGPTVFGPGDTEVGFKYRFIEEDKDGARPMVGIFPMLELPTGSQPRGLGVGHLRVYLPVWVQKSYGDWTTYGGGGYWLNQNDNLGDKNYWYVGWLLQRKITEKLVLGGEIYHQTAANILGVDSTGFNFGGAYDVDEHNHLLFSAGRGFQNAAEANLYSWYLAWQVTY